VAEAPAGGAPPVERAPRAPIGPRPAAARVLGTVVVGGSDAPVADALVVLFDGPLFGPGSAAGARAIARASSAADGRYDFPVPDAGATYAVRVEAEGFATRARNQLPGVDVPLELAPGATLAGRVRGDGAAAARVLLPGGGDGGAWRRVDDGAGAYAVSGLAAGESPLLRVEPAGALPFPSAVPPLAPGANRHDVDLGPTVELAGLVVDAFDGTPVAGARVAGAGAGGPAPAGARVVATSDGAGRFPLRLRGPWAATAERGERAPLFVSVDAAGYLGSSAFLRPGADGPRFELVPGGRIQGRVLHADGAGAAGASVAWAAPLELLDARFGALCPGAAARDARAGPDGSFALDEVPWAAAEAMLVARAGDDPAERRVRFVFGAAPALPARAGGARELEIRLPRGGSVQGRAAWRGRRSRPLDLAAALDGTHPPAEPPPRASLELVDGSGASGATVATGEPIARTATDAAGGFLFDGLAAGVYRVRAAAPLEGEALARVTEGPPEPVWLGLQPPARTLAGALRDACGRPLAGQLLALRLRVSFDDPLGTPAFWDFGAKTRADGTFELVWHDPGAHVPVLATSVGWTELEREAPAGADAALAWDLPELVRVRLALGEEARPIQRVLWRGPGPDERGCCAHLLRAADGTLELALPAGWLELALEPAGAPPSASRPVHVRAGEGEDAVRIDLAGR